MNNNLLLQSKVLKYEYMFLTDLRFMNSFFLGLLALIHIDSPSVFFIYTPPEPIALSAPPPLYTETLYRLGERLSRNRVRRNSGISGIFSYEILTFLSALDRFPNFSGQVDKSPGILLELSKDCTK